MLAAQNGHLDIIKYLVHHSAKPITRDHKGWTAFHWATRFGYLDIIKFLKDYTDDSLNVTDENGDTLIHEAVRSSQLEVLNYLLPHSSHPNPPNKDGTTPMC